MRISLVIFCCLTVFMSAYILEAQVVTDGLVSYYTLDKKDIDGKIVKDAFGNNDGTIIGEPKSVAGHLGEGLEFASQPDCVELPKIFTIGKEPATYETWFQKTDKTSWQYLIVNKSNFHNNFFRLGFNENTGQVRFYTEHENEENTVFVTDKDYADGKWHHVVAIRDVDEAKIYVNGVLVKEGAAMPGDIGGDKTNWYLAQDGNNNGYLIGAMDEVRIYERALTEKEVQQNFKAKGLAVVDGKNKLSITWAVIKEVN